MENIGVIVLFLIISIISGIIKKAKEKEQEKGTTTFFNAKGKPILPKERKRGNSISSILKEIMQGDTINKMKENSPRKNYSIPITSIDDDNNYTSSKRENNNQTERKVTRNTTLNLKTDHDFSAPYNKKKRVKKLTVKKLLKNKNDVRKAMIFNEIINKNRTFNF